MQDAHPFVVGEADAREAGTRAGDGNAQLAVLFTQGNLAAAHKRLRTGRSLRCAERCEQGSGKSRKQGDDLHGGQNTLAGVRLSVNSAGAGGWDSCPLATSRRRVAACLNPASTPSTER